jgi:hypothetical protein
MDRGINAEQFKFQILADFFITAGVAFIILVGNSDKSRYGKIQVQQTFAKRCFDIAGKPALGDEKKPSQDWNQVIRRGFFRQRIAGFFTFFSGFDQPGVNPPEAFENVRQLIF